MSVKKIFTVFILISSSLSWAYEPRSLNPDLDRDFIDSLGLSDPTNSNRFNLLLVGYDAPIPGTENTRASRRHRDANGGRRKALTSRSDIMMVLSFNREARSIDILSVGRDYEPNGNCWSRAPLAYKSGLRNKGGSKINGAVVLYGRRIMIHCLRSVMTENLSHTPYANQFEVDAEDGLLPIHAIHEVERGKDASSSDIGQLRGVDLSGLMTISLAWVYSEAVGTLTSIGNRYQVIFNGLKRRNYPAGSYQRAFNSAKFVADVIGWSAPGVQYTVEEGYNFLEWENFSNLDDIFGGSHKMLELNEHLSYYPNGSDTAVDNMLRYGAFVENPGTGPATKRNPYGPEAPVSPIRIIQFGDRADSFAVYQNGILDRSMSPRGSYMEKLRVRPVLHLPNENVMLCPDCHIKPELSPGTWGRPHSLQ